MNRATFSRARAHNGRDRELVETLPTLQRLSLAYCPSMAREATIALFALDARLAGIVRSSREPMLAQLRLAWWREILAQPADRWPQGEPLLAQLRLWEPHAGVLVDLANGWEAMTSPPPLVPEAIDALADARAESFRALAALIATGRGEEPAFRMARAWALVDIAERLSQPEEVRAARVLLAGQIWRAERLPRAMRPLAVLHALAARAVRRNERLDELGPRGLLAAVRIGTLGF